MESDHKGCTDSSFSIKEEEDFIDLKNDLVHKASFAELELSTFWISLQNQYPELSMKALRSLLPFGSSYLCEIAFSSLTEIKSKKRERLQMIDGEMRVYVNKPEDKALSENCPKPINTHKT
ncbi:protein FAM200A-like [Diachasmimorpha longicaudata]|uniref:protein FAM200A-like n=1 Tax=Diachasmimorpha longicaudata TaxID=58733 RepID=UPI0030B919C9